MPYMFSRMIFASKASSLEIFPDSTHKGFNPMTINTDDIGSIATVLKEKGVSAVARNRIMSDIKAAVANADKGDPFAPPVTNNLTRDEQQRLTYAATLALASARRVGVTVDPTKGITVEQFDMRANKGAEPTARIVAKSQLAALGLLIES
jgi:hypothetical protein